MLSRDSFRTKEMPKFYKINVTLVSLTLWSCSSDPGHAQEKLKFTKTGRT